MLSALVFLPLVFSFILICIKDSDLCRKTALVFSCFYFLFSLLLFFFFDPTTSALQLTEQINWFEPLGIKYFLGIDGLSFWFVILTAFLNPICVLASWNLIKEKSSSKNFTDKRPSMRVSFFYACLFGMNTAVVGTFLALDAVLFYIFFESSLIPLYFIIGIYGGKQRLYASCKFFIYTAFGSLFLLAGITALMVLTFQSQGVLSANLLDFYKLNIPFTAGEIFSTQNIVFLCFFFAFAVKLPFVPFHTWLPLAHGEAPAPGSALLAGVILKMGAYGFLRFVLPLFPDSVSFFAPLISLLAGLAVIYGALMALAQTDIKKLVAYSSVSHMAYVLLGLFSLNLYGLVGGFYQMLTHAVSSAGLFLLTGIIYERTHSLNIADYKGLAKTMPLTACFFIILSLSSLALPSTGGFVSEFLVLLGVFSAKNGIALVCALIGTILSAVYMLYLVHRVFFGPPSALSKKAQALLKREKILILPLVLLVFVMGLFPRIFLKYSTPSLNLLQKPGYNLSIKDNYE